MNLFFFLFIPFQLTFKRFELTPSWTSSRIHSVLCAFTLEFTLHWHMVEDTTTLSAQGQVVLRDIKIDTNQESTVDKSARMSGNFKNAFRFLLVPPLLYFPVVTLLFPSPSPSAPSLTETQRRGGNRGGSVDKADPGHRKTDSRRAKEAADTPYIQPSLTGH